MPQSPFYSSPKWRKTREEHLRRFPGCVVCKAVGFFTRAIEVDHVISMRNGGAPFDHANLRSLCKSHHSQKTIMLDGAHKASGKLLVTTGPDGYPVHIEKPQETVRVLKRFR